MKFTARNIETEQLPPGKIDHVVWDDDVAGFGLRLRAGGSRSWIYRYRLGPKQRSVKLGSATSVPLSMARANAIKLEARVRLGEDPALDIESAKREAGETFIALAEQFLEARRSEWRPATYREVRRHLLSYTRPLHAMPIANIAHRDVANLLNNIAKSSGAISANRLRATLSSLYSWAMKEGVELPKNVAAATNKRDEHSRDRILNDVELAAVWHACKGDDFGIIVRLLILLGQRRSEIALLTWAEIQGDKIVLPASRVKNHREHVIPLSSAAKVLLDGVERSGRHHVFGRSGNGFGAWIYQRELLDARLAAAGETLPQWTLHDLRRSCASGMQRLGIRSEVIEVALNHRSGAFKGVAGIYQRDPLTDNVRDALEHWGRHVTEIAR
jgi:integrase